MVSISTKMRRGVAETLSRPTHQLTASHWHARCVAEVATAMHHQGGHDAYVGMIGLGRGASVDRRYIIGARSLLYLIILQHTVME
jgi:hypothetical protein